MASHHDLFKALGPIDWSSLSENSISDSLTHILSQGRSLASSIPSPTPVASLPPPPPITTTTRPRSQTESDVPNSPTNPKALPPSKVPNTSPDTSAIDSLRKEWQEVKLNPRDNPNAMSVYKLSAKDGRGAWFARRSIHEDVSFDKFKLGLEREFAESLPPPGAVEAPAPGQGNVRGIGADKRVERRVCEGVGRAEVYLLSAQFPGPTTPRDFVTLFCSSEEGLGGEKGGGDGEHMKGRERRRGLVRGGLRQHVIVSKPCAHAACAPRTGYIRGSYESVEIIREIPTERTVRKVRSSIDIREGRVESEGLGGKSVSLMPNAGAAEKERPQMAIEWLMITRSDPGGSVPRFMVEKGTPGGIVTDAGRFLAWLAKKTTKNLEQEGAEDEVAQGPEQAEDSVAERDPVVSAIQPRPVDEIFRRTPTSPPTTKTTIIATATEVLPAPGGFYNMIAGAVGAASSIVAARLPVSLIGIASSVGTISEVDESSSSDASDQEDQRSFVSAEDHNEDKTSVAIPQPSEHHKQQDSTSITSVSGDSSRSRATSNPTLSANAQLYEKHLRKLDEKRKKVQDKIFNQQQERDALATKRNSGIPGDGSNGSNPEEDTAAALARLKEKHARDLAKHQETYQKEVKKLEEKRLKEERKAEERRKKAAGKEERKNLGMALEKVTIERDVARKQLELLKEQIGELQAQNTMLVAKLGKMGESFDGSVGEGYARREARVDTRAF